MFGNVLEGVRVGMLSALALALALVALGLIV